MMTIEHFGNITYCSEILVTNHTRQFFIAVQIICHYFLIKQKSSQGTSALSSVQTTLIMGFVCL